MTKMSRPRSEQVKYTIPTSLTPKMKEVIEYRIAHPDYNDAQIGAAINVSRPTLSRWKRSEVYEQELNRRLEEIWKDARAIAQKEMIDMASNGDFNACKYILDSNGYKAPDNINLDATLNMIEVDIVDD